MARQEDLNDMDNAPKKGSNKILIIAAIVFVNAAVIGGVLYFVLNSRPASSSAEAGTDKKVEQVKKKEVPVIYPLEPFIVNIGDGHDMRYLKVKVEFETSLSAEKAKMELDPYLAPLRDSILVLLTTKTIQDVQDLPGKNRLRQEILAAANKVLPAGKVNNIYFTDFVVQ